MDPIGWALLVALASSFALVIATRRTWARFWFDLEDPRAMALFRIVFGSLVLCNVNGLVEHFAFLFSDEGILPADAARQVFAARQFAGFGEGAPGEPVGFFDLPAVGRFVAGPRLSLLWFWDTPTAMWLHVAAFEVVTVLFVVGLWTRASGIASLALMLSFQDRNPLYLEGTDVVFRVFFVYLVCARSGHAWSVDNWLRCRRLRRAGRLDEGSTGTNELGLEPVYRRIPVWPRRLMMLQLAAVYVTTGALKSGSVWARGDAVYYAMSLDHFYRWPTQPLTALLGTNVLRVVTWMVRFGEIGFGLVFVGAVLRVAEESRDRDPRHPRLARVLRWIRIWVLGRRVWLTWALVTMGGIFVAMNIGMFQPIMLALCLVYLRGEEVARAMAKLRGAAAPLAAADPPRAARDRVRVPTWAWTTACVLAVVGAAFTSTAPLWAAVAFVLGVTVRRSLRIGRLHEGGRARCYGPLGRVVLVALLSFHVAAVAVWLVPDREPTRAFRRELHPWFEPWLDATRTTQGWGMFAPNPPRANVFMKVVVVDGRDRWDMRTDLYADERRVFPFLFNDRMRKINRRIIGGESGGGSWYRKWYARWQCRDWALSHDGRVPTRVELVRVSYRIPPPEATATLGWYRPADRLRAHATERTVHTETCATAILGQPSPRVAARHGIVSSVPHRPWVIRRRAAWERRADLVPLALPDADAGR